MTPFHPRRLLARNLAPLGGEEPRGALPGFQPETADYYLLRVKA